MRLPDTKKKQFAVDPYDGCLMGTHVCTSTYVYHRDAAPHSSSKQLYSITISVVRSRLVYGHTFCLVLHYRNFIDIYRFLACELAD